MADEQEQSALNCLDLYFKLESAFALIAQPLKQD